MIAREDKRLVDRAGSVAVPPCQLASLPRATAKAMEQITDTMLAALHTETGAVWLEHEGKIYTLVLRNITIQTLQALQQTMSACGQPYPVVLQAQEQNYAVACAGYPLLRVYTAVGVEELRSVHRRLMPRFTRLAQTLLQTSNAPIGVPAEDTNHQAYRVVVEGGSAPPVRTDASHGLYPIVVLAVEQLVASVRGGQRADMAVSAVLGDALAG